MSNLETQISAAFVCEKCSHQKANIEKLAMSGTGLSRFLEIQLHRYVFISCLQCGHTEVFNLRVLEGSDNFGTLLDIIFSG